METVHFNSDMQLPAFCCRSKVAAIREDRYAKTVSHLAYGLSPGTDLLNARLEARTLGSGHLLGEWSSSPPKVRDPLTHPVFMFSRL